MKALCTGDDKLNPFALPHRVVTRITKDRKKYNYDSLFRLTSDVARKPFLTVSDQVRHKTWVYKVTGDR